jgi:hypothetical protein
MRGAEKATRTILAPARKPRPVLAMISAYFYVGSLGEGVSAWGCYDGVAVELNWCKKLHCGKGLQEVPWFMISKQ